MGKGNGGKDRNKFVITMMGIMNMIRSVGWECFLGQVGIFTKVNTAKTNATAMAKCNGQTAASTKVNGTEESSTVTVK